MSVRVVTLNLWGLEPDLERRLALAERQLRVIEPDVVCLQEVRHLDGRKGPTTAHRLAEALRMPSVVYATASEWPAGHFAANEPAGEDGLALIARHPLLEQRVRELPEPRTGERRVLLSGRFGVPSADQGFWVHNTHLHWRLADGIARERQVVAIDDAVRDTESAAPQVICGDFNCEPDSDEIRFMTGKHTLAERRTHYQDAYAHVHPHEDGFTWCAKNAATRRKRSLDVDRRIDYVFVTTRQKDGRGTIRSCDVTLDQRDDMGDCASDHYGVVAEIQLSP